MDKDFDDIKNKKIYVVGLGLIGGSISLALKHAGYRVYGVNRSPKPLEYALSHGVVDEARGDVKDADIVFLCLPPKACAEFMDSHEFKRGAYLYDICGVKVYMENAVFSRARNFLYVGLHPMAGKEVSGVENADDVIFHGASMVVTSSQKTHPKAYETAKFLTREMGFSRIIECTAKVHDEKIAYTSQLAHVVSNAYVKNEKICGCFGFTGGSFQDMTRIAGVDEKVWSELFLLNGENLTADISRLCRALTDISDAVSSKDKERLEKTLLAGRKLFEEGRENKPSDGITVIELKGKI
ncbi:MAG: prephenate dehydrogenase [Clostridia bacterium]|nr:prephenate dehydrogenase [Clostridia bacterium]